MILATEADGLIQQPNETLWFLFPLCLSSEHSIRSKRIGDGTFSRTSVTLNLQYVITTSLYDLKNTITCVHQNGSVKYSRQSWLGG